MAPDRVLRLFCFYKKVHLYKEYEQGQRSGGMVVKRSETKVIKPGLQANIIDAKPPAAMVHNRGALLWNFKICMQYSGQTQSYIPCQVLSSFFWGT